VIASLDINYGRSNWIKTRIKRSLTFRGRALDGSQSKNERETRHFSS
jgi:hypothetical protein